MLKILLTDIVASSAKPMSDKQVSLWDTRTRSFGLRINPQGTKTWQVMIGEKRQRITIGHYPDMSLKRCAAREEHRHHAISRLGSRLPVH